MLRKMDSFASFVLLALAYGMLPACICTITVAWDLLCCYSCENLFVKNDEPSLTSRLTLGRSVENLWNSLIDSMFEIIYHECCESIDWCAQLRGRTVI